MSTRPEKTHRREYTERVSELARKFRRCSIEPRVPRKFSSASKVCAPTQKQACEFEGVEIEEVHRKEDLLTDQMGWLRLLGCGVGRCAYEFKKGCVVKFARGGRRNGELIGAKPWWGQPDYTGEDMNTYEVSSYAVAEDRVKDLLVPIVAHSPKAPYKWLVMPKAETEDDFGKRKAENIVFEIEDMLDERNASCADLHGGNVGLLNGKPVIIDPGFGVVCRRSPPKPRRKTRKLKEFM